MDVKVSGLENLERLGREFPKASARALNKTMTHVRAEMAKEARQRYKAKSSDVKASMGQSKLATAKHLSTYFRSKGKRIALTYFMTKSTITRSLEQAGRKIKRRGIVAFEVTRGAKRRLPYAFVAQMKSGHVGVFTRTSGKMKSNPKKQAIEERTGPAVSQMLSGSFSRMKDVQEFLRRTLAHEIEWFRQGKGGLGG